MKSGARLEYPSSGTIEANGGDSFGICVARASVFYGAVLYNGHEVLITI